MINECPVCSKLTERVEVLEAASKPAEPATEKPAKPTITKVGRIWRDGHLIRWSGWEIAGSWKNGKCFPEAIGDCFPGYTFDELARESVLKNPRVGDKFRFTGEERVVARLDRVEDEKGTHCGAPYAYIPTETASHFRPIADTPEAKAEVRVYKVGDKVILGRHELVNGEANWADDMDQHVGKMATITRLYRYLNHEYAAVDTNSWDWRTQNMTLAIQAHPLPVQPSEQAAQDALGIADNRKTLPTWCYYCKLTLPDDAAVKAHRCPQHPLVQEIAKLEAELAALKSATPGAEGKRLLEMAKVHGSLDLRQRCKMFNIPFDANNSSVNEWNIALVEQVEKALTERQDLHIQDLLKSPHVIAKIAELFAAMKNP